MGVAVYGALNIRLLVLAFPVKYVNWEAYPLVEIISICNEVSVEAAVVIVEYNIWHRALDAKYVVNHSLTMNVRTNPMCEKQWPLTTVCGVVSDPKKVWRATIIPQGRTMICSLCVRRLPNKARIL